MYMASTHRHPGRPRGGGHMIAWVHEVMLIRGINSYVGVQHDGVDIGLPRYKLICTSATCGTYLR